MKTKFNEALRGLCSATIDFNVISKELVVDKKERRHLLQRYAAEVKKAADKFLETCEEMDNGTIQRRD